MAFPESVKTFVEAVDPSSAEDIQNIQQYQSLLESGNFNAASALLGSMTNGIKMNMNAGRFNDVLSEIIAIEEFYLGLNGVKEYIQKNIDKYSYINKWDKTISYTAGNIVSYNAVWYLCLVDNTNKQPDVNVKAWEVFLKPQDAKQYPVQAEEPVDQKVGDLWFKVVD